MDQRRHFSSTREFLNWMNANKPRYGWQTSSWDGDHESVDRGLEIMARGDDSKVDQARSMMQNLSEKLESPHFTWEHQVAGAFPDVPALLAGEPENMWYKSPKPDDRTPLRVWVGLTSSGGIGTRILTQRGVTLAAFAMAIAEVRPVLITPYVNLGRSMRGGNENALISWDISTSPLVLSELLGCTTNPSVTRYVGIESCYVLNPNVDGGWHRDFAKPDRMRANLGAQEQDLYIPSIHAHDELVSNPLEWLKTNIAKYGQENEE